MRPAHGAHTFTLSVLPVTLPSVEKRLVRCWSVLQVASNRGMAPRIFTMRYIFCSLAVLAFAGVETARAQSPLSVLRGLTKSETVGCDGLNEHYSVPGGTV